MEAAADVIQKALQVVYRLAADLESKALWVDAELDSEMWECVGLLCSIGPNLEIARGLLSAGADSAEQYVGSVLDASVVGRGLLYNSLALCIRIGVLDDPGDIEGYCQLLSTRGVAPVAIVVAYLDYLGTTDELDADFGERFASLGRDFAGGLPTFRWRSHYWASSDSYSLFGILDSADEGAQVKAFVRDLIWVQ